jgi:hypothetical protein
LLVLEIVTAIPRPRALRAAKIHGAIRAQSTPYTLLVQKHAQLGRTRRGVTAGGSSRQRQPLMQPQRTERDDHGTERRRRHHTATLGSRFARTAAERATPVSPHDEPVRCALHFLL